MALITPGHAEAGGKAMHDLRLEQHDPVAGKGAAEIHQAEQQDAPVEQRLLQAVAADRLALGAFGVAAV